jgi:hypothetical protein
VSEPVSPTSAQGRYGALLSERDPFLRRAEDCAALTIPSLLPPEGYNGSSKLDQPYQSVGARGVNNLAAKILLALFPPGSSFFRLSLDDKVLEELTAEFDGDQKKIDAARTTFEAGLGKMERSVLTRLEQVGARAPLHDGVRHLLVAGNVLLQILGRGQVRCHYLNKFVCKRDPEGNPLEIVVKECFARATLPLNVLTIVEAADAANPEKSPANTVDVYTHIRLVDGEWKAYQEVMGQLIPGTEGSYPKDKSPWIPLRFTRIEGESYGRSMVEEYMGDLRSLEALAQAIVEIAGIAATVRFLVNPAGVTKAERLARARNGAFVPGDAKDVTSLALDKIQDFRVAKETADGIEKRLGEGFLLGSAAVRDAERVTAEEVRLIASELEQALGGFYSVLAQELQYPLVARYMHIMTADKTLPVLPKDTVRPSIVTGLEALGRGGDLQKLDTLLAGITQIFGEEAIKEYVNVGDYVIRRATALGLDIKGLIRSDEEVAQSRQQASAQQMVEKLGPTMLKNTAEQQGAATAGAEPNPE